METNIKISINSMSNTVINDIEIIDTVTNEGLVNYGVREVSEEIDNLINWISECATSDRTLMKDDLKYLMGLEDEYVFSSTSTNDYVAYSDDEENFISIGNDILEANKRINMNYVPCEKYGSFYALSDDMILYSAPMYKDGSMDFCNAGVLETTEGLDMMLINSLVQGDK